MEFRIEEMESSDWNQVSLIYREGIDSDNATFETTLFSSGESWVSDHIPGCNIIARKEDRILGWAAVSPTSHRKVYSGVAEVTVYVNEKHRGKGIGMALLRKFYNHHIYIHRNDKKDKNVILRVKI